MLFIQKIAFVPVSILKMNFSKTVLETSSELTLVNVFPFHSFNSTSLPTSSSEASFVFYLSFIDNFMPLSIFHAFFEFAKVLIAIFDQGAKTILNAVFELSFVEKFLGFVHFLFKSKTISHAFSKLAFDQFIISLY